MEADRKKRLTELGTEALADALLELSVRDDVADDLIERLMATPRENIQRYKAKLANLKRRQRFVSWNVSAAFAHEYWIKIDCRYSLVSRTYPSIDCLPQIQDPAKLSFSYA